MSHPVHNSLCEGPRTSLAVSLKCNERSIDDCQCLESKEQNLKVDNETTRACVTQIYGDLREGTIPLFIKRVKTQQPASKCSDEQKCWRISSCRRVRGRSRHRRSGLLAPREAPCRGVPGNTPGRRYLACRLSSSQGTTMSRPMVNIRILRTLPVGGVHFKFS